MTPQQSTARKAPPGPAANGEAPQSAANLPATPEELKDIHYYMKLSREFDQRMVEMFRAGQLLGTYFAQVGQEACDVVPGYFTRETDDLFLPSHRDLAGAFVKGAPVYELACNVKSRATSQDKGNSHPVFWGYTQGGFLVCSSVIANQYCPSVGVALAYKMRGMKNVVIQTLGEGGSSKGALYEAMNFAGIHRLPVIFVIQNNWWAESVPIHLQAAVEDLTLRAIGFNMPGIRLDGNDVPNMIGPVRAAVERARNGEGPTLFQFDTYRWYGHSSIDPANYRDQAEVDYWKAKDPIATFERWLMEQGIYTEAQLTAREQEIRAHIEAEVIRAEQDPDPDTEDYKQYVYCPEGDLPAPVQQRWQHWDGKRVS